MKILRYINAPVLLSSDAFHKISSFHLGFSPVRHLRLYSSRETFKNHSLYEKLKLDSGVRINRCFPEYSRRDADKIIASGRVLVNEKKASLGQMIFYDDIITVDGIERNWKLYISELSQRVINGIKSDSSSIFIYLKVWKPKGITCTTNQRDPNNIIKFLLDQSKEYNSNEINHSNLSTNSPKANILSTHMENGRLFTIGRLDKDSEGLIVVSNDVRLSSLLLGANLKTPKPKKYIVSVDKSIIEEDIKKLIKGFEISSPNTNGKIIKRSTLPSKVKIIDDKSIEIEIVEGRNRQIRRMLQTLGYQVKSLHRLKFGSLNLNRLKYPGDWDFMTPDELDNLLK